jgi:hypothetical protein
MVSRSVISSSSASGTPLHPTPSPVAPSWLPCLLRTSGASASLSFGVIVPIIPSPATAEARGLGLPGKSRHGPRLADLAALIVNPALSVGDAWPRPGRARHNGVCGAYIDELAGRAGVSRATVQRALRQARALGLITVQERRRRGQKSLANIVRIVSREWIQWIGFYFRNTTQHKVRKSTDAPSRREPTPAFRSLMRLGRAVKNE